MNSLKSNSGTLTKPEKVGITTWDNLCKIHPELSQCKGRLVTRRSVYGAILTACRGAWDGPIEILGGSKDNTRRIYIPLKLWLEEIGNHGK